ncbi:MAG: hypothetical protein ACN6I3_00200 [bacterium]
MADQELVLARWGGGGEQSIVEVRGFESSGMLRLAPTDVGEGEVLLPVSEVGNLHFIFSDAYREAQLRESVGRPAEALYLLQQEIPAILPYAVLDQSNVPGAVRRYLRLLQQMESWPEAVAIASMLTQDDHPHSLVGDLLNLIRDLIRVERIDDAAWVLGRIPLNQESSYCGSVERVAHEMRRAGYWREAGSVYARLSDVGAAWKSTPWAALEAYCTWHLGDAEPATRLLQARPMDSGAKWAGLLGLLRGRVALRNGETALALDSLGEALIHAPADSEWRLEITAVIAESYRLHGQPALAQRLQNELNHWYPESLWATSPARH